MPNHREDTEAGHTSRRTALTVAGGATIVGALAACSSDDELEPAAPDADGEAAAGDGAADGGPLTVQAADVPVGGGTIYATDDVVVTQPEQGTFAAFSATCTHQGCSVTDVAGGTINCACHNSSFSISDGSVVDGPADSPLPEVAIQVDGDTITLT